ncbi:MAG: type II toxin-antitoxin system VapC family toxin [Steroidobacteraceae bacterium]
MSGVDTNLLVRWLIDDDEKQSSLVQSVLESARRRHATLFVPNTVTLELEWVLRSRYQLGKADILAAFNGLLDSREIEFQDEAALERALTHYRDGAAEFADCMHSGICAAMERSPLLTFDKLAARLPGVELLAG